MERRDARNRAQQSQASTQHRLFFSLATWVGGRRLGHRGMSNRASASLTKASTKAVKVRRKKPVLVAGGDDAEQGEQGREAPSTPPRDDDGFFRFETHPEFRPNLSPKQILQRGAFGGTYFRPIQSSVVKKRLVGAWKEFPADWFEGLDIARQVASSQYRVEVNKYRAKTGQSLEEWESKGWIVAQDPFGWFQWYCRYFLGRRTQDDLRQIRRWASVAGDKGRWRRNLIAKIYKAHKSFNDKSVSPAVRQLLLHWAYDLTSDDFEAYVVELKQGKTTSFIPATLEDRELSQKHQRELEQSRSQQKADRADRVKRRKGNE